MNSKKKVLHVISSMDMGGAETMIMNIYREIDREEIQFDFLVSVSGSSYYDSEIESLGGSIYHTCEKSKHPFKYGKFLWSLIKKEKYPIIHVHASNTMAAFPILIAKYAGVKQRIVHSHSSASSINKTIHQMMQPLLNISSTDRYSCSDLASKWMYGSKKKSLIVNNPINCASFKFDNDMRMKTRRELNLKEKITFVHVGRFSNPKNHKFLIEIFNEIHKIEKNSVLLLVGEGEMEMQIKKLVSRLNLNDSVVFLGLKSDVYNILHASDYFIFPSLYEGLPVTLIEAQAAGIQCYISDTITDEIKITDLITSISLKETPEYWAEIILSNLSKYNNRENFNDLVYSKYDSKLVANMYIEEYYNS